MPNGRKALRIEIFILVLVIVFLATYTTTESTVIDNYEDYQKIELLVKRWAPIIWLAPGERFMPLGVTEFLDHVYAAEGDGKMTITFSEGRTLVRNDGIPHGEDSKMLYLHTKRNLESLTNSTSFIHGINPQSKPVPIYVTVRYCDAPTITKRTFYQPTANFLNDILYGQMDRLSMSMLEQRSRAASGLRFTVSYWMFYPYNEGKDVCFLGNFPAPFIFNTCFGKKRRFGNHVGDFEHLTLSFSGNAHPDELYLSVHDTGVYYTYDRAKHLFRFRSQRSAHESTLKSSLRTMTFPPLVRLTGDRPVVYAARGSHGLWAAPGEHLFVRVPRLYDEAGYGSPWKTWRDVKVYRLGLDTAPFWMGFEGKWGNPKANCLLFRKLGICELSDGPQGVLMRKQDFQC